MPPAVATHIVPTIEDIVPALCGGGTPLLRQTDADELIRLERLRAGTDEAVRYVLAGSRLPRPLGLLPVYPVAAPFRPGEHPAARFGARAEDWRLGYYLGSSGATPAVMPAAADPVRTALVRAGLRLVREAASRPDFVALPLLDDDLLRSVEPLVAADRPLLAESHEAYLDLDFDSFDGYLRKQPADRRKKVRKELRRFGGSGLRVVVVDLLRQYPRLAPLLRSVEAKYGVPDRIETYETYLLSIGLALGDRAVCLAAYDAGDPVAFTVIWDQGPVWRLRCWGCDYARTADTYAYFCLGLYEPLRLAAEAGVTRLVLGEGTLAAKRERGAVLRRLTSLAVALTSPSTPVSREPVTGTAAGASLRSGHSCDDRTRPHGARHRPCRAPCRV